MTRTRTIARTVTVLLAPIAAVCTAPASPASADTVALLAQADVYISTWTPTTATVCAAGSVDTGTPLVGVWTFTAGGVGVGVNVPVVGSSVGPTFPGQCVTVTTGPAGVVEGLLTYTGATGDVIALCGITGARHPLNHNEVGYCSDSAWTAA
ncbi:MAG TPA: hypothetical protein VF519_08665 [Mycobacteriales bacterium]|jgi:hypothetical protein